MKAYVYKSARKADAYVYLRERDDFARVPADLLQQLGALSFALEVELAPGRKLARVDVEAVRSALEASGFFLQLPPPPDRAG